MAKLKIREGSCEVWHVGASTNKLDDKTHKKGNEIKIWFTKQGTKYTFKDGMLIGMS